MSRKSDSEETVDMKLPDGSFDHTSMGLSSPGVMSAPGDAISLNARRYEVGPYQACTNGAGRRKKLRSPTFLR